MYIMEEYTRMENQGWLDLPVHRTSFNFFPIIAPSAYIAIQTE